MEKYKWKLIEVGSQYAVVNCDPENDKTVACVNPDDTENVDILIDAHNKIVDMFYQFIKDR